MLVYLALIQYFIMLLHHSCRCVILVQITLLCICVTWTFSIRCDIVFTAFYCIYFVYILCIPVCHLSSVSYVYGPCCLVQNKWIKGVAYQRGANVGEGSRADGYALVLGKRHVRLVVNDDTNASSFSQIADVFILVSVEHHWQTCKRSAPDY